MSEYIDFEIARKYLHEACAGLGSNGGLMLKIKFDEEPKADVVEVVRCKECIHMGTDKCPSRLNDADFYCCQGERREDDGL